MLIPSIDLKGGKVVQLVQGERLAITSDDLEGWIMREVEAGVPLPGLYPSNEATKARYEAWRSTQPRK